MSHFSHVLVTPALLFPAAVGPTGRVHPGALTDDGCCQPGAAELRCHVCVPGPDPWSASTNPDCSLSAPPAPHARRCVTHTLASCSHSLHLKYPMLQSVALLQVIINYLFKKMLKPFCKAVSSAIFINVKICVCPVS